MKNKLILSFGIILFSMVSCKSTKITDNQEMGEKIIWINSSKVPCEGVGPMTCLQIQEGEEIEDGKWLNFFSNIEGFDYKPGNVYRIKVNVAQLAPPIPADTSSRKYSLVEVISQKPDLTLRITDIWRLESIGEMQNPTGMDKPLIFEFNAAERGIFGFSGCNTVRGPITKLTETEIEFGNLMSTMMACPQDEMILERGVTYSLKEIKKYKIENNRLYLATSDGTPLMIFLKVD
jgi:heat shock protein HslJ